MGQEAIPSGAPLEEFDFSDWHDAKLKHRLEQIFALEKSWQKDIEKLEKELANANFALLKLRKEEKEIICELNKRKK